MNIKQLRNNIKNLHGSKGNENFNNFKKIEEDIEKIQEVLKLNNYITSEELAYEINNIFLRTFGGDVYPEPAFKTSTLMT